MPRAGKHDDKRLIQCGKILNLYLDNLMLLTEEFQNANKAWPTKYCKDNRKNVTLFKH